MAKTNGKPQKLTPARAIRDRVKALRRVRAGDLRPNPKNWRTHPANQRSALAGILAEVGYAGALLARETKDGLELIDGHLRAETTPDMKVPVLVLDVTQEEADKLLAAYDPLSAMAERDNGRLSELLASVKTDDDALRAMFAELQEHAVVPIVEDEVPPIPKTAVTKPGELWLLGEHRLLCGDSTKPADVARLMRDDRAGLMNTDPPYGVDYAATKNGIPRSGFKNIVARGGEIENDDLVDGPALQEFLEAAIRTAVPHLIDNPAFYLWHPMLTQGTFFAAAAAAAAILIHRQIIWVKPHMVLTRSGQYHWRHELCFYGWIRGKPPNWYGDKSQTSVWEVGQSQRGRVHPTQKPVALFERPIQNHTQHNEVIYEPFAGSGPQFIAAEQLNRRCYGIEIEPKYADVIVERWQKFTGGKALREGGNRGKARTQGTADNAQAHAGKPRPAKAQRTRAQA